MTKNDVNSLFLKTLESNAISTATPKSLAKMKLVTEKIPEPSDLVEIPDEEIFPISEILDETNKEITPQEITKSALSDMLSSFIQRTKVLKPPTVEKSNLQNMMIYDDPQQFIEFKREYATYLSAVASNLGIPVSAIQLCSFPLCLNQAIPNFHFCINHMEMEHEFDKVDLFSRCNFTTQGERCETPCSPKFQYCTFHRQKLAKSKKENKGFQ